MNKRKYEYITELVLSVFIMTLALAPENPSTTAKWGIAAIALVHSFNLKRFVDAYREAQYQKQQEQPENYR